MSRYNGPADPSTPCDLCGGPTYTFASGSVWCPDESKHPGGHFVRRVAFEQSPLKSGAVPVTKTRAPKPVRAAKPKADDSWAPSLHDYVESK
jgi:hypothetical protein